MKQRQSMGGVGLLILMLLVIMFFSLKVPGMATERELSYPEFMVYLENKTVEGAQIRPNREVPTGEVVFETTSGDREEFNVLDVKEVEMALRKAGVPYTTTSVRQDSYFMTVILPIALSAGVLIFLFMFINSRSGGGANLFCRLRDGERLSRSKAALSFSVSPFSCSARPYTRSLPGIPDGPGSPPAGWCWRRDAPPARGRIPDRTSAPWRA